MKNLECRVVQRSDADRKYDIVDIIDKPDFHDVQIHVILGASSEVNCANITHSLALEYRPRDVATWLVPRDAHVVSCCILTCQFVHTDRVMDYYIDRVK